MIGCVGETDEAVTGLEFDSRRVAPGDLFFCIPGHTSDGHDFAPTAVTAGAAALCVERSLGLDVPEIRVAHTRAAMPLIAAEALGRPSDRMTMLGVTGTNGKTTTTYLLDSILRASGQETGLIGTIETRIGDQRRPGIRTTPESLDLQRLLAEMGHRKVTSVAMEVTSHALALNRVDGITFTAAAFTNLTQDHLDFHADMEAYFAAKRSLFTEGRVERGAVNVDDPFGERLRDEASIPMVGFGTSGGADIRARDVEMLPSGSSFTATTPDGDLQVTTSLVGPFNVSNCLAAIACSLQAGVSHGAISEGIAALKNVPGRFESLDVGQPFSVIIDYAHTPDSLENVLKAARRMALGSGGRVICVFGCGGDRDRGKRPLMGMAVARLADHVVVTSDNPRSEDPASIIGQILEGVVAVRVSGPDATFVDRREAITHAIHEAQPSDVVVIAGKGHETGQQFSDHTIPFDDRVVAREVLADLGSVE
ncbi:MAG: UDP-N-acetylmuramoyl-L-alanyl-D-glutamate--2,6-diaminopimelate ligase [Actinobacteria bacterium]|nr:UDP-N-acetylmuramoyl-L-alanyl-D-glutamate--2,6-diaminopimelate ligase [Actinomycetota bacterium]